MGTLRQISDIFDLSFDTLLKEDREMPDLNLWLEISSKDPEKIQSFYEQISELPEVTSLSLERTLDLCGILLSREKIQTDLDKFEIDSYGLTQSKKEIPVLHSGKVVSGYWVDPYIIGLDDDTFRTYAKKAGYEIPTGKQYPVLAEDYLMIRTETGDTRRNILSAEPDEPFFFIYSRYGDMDGHPSLIERLMEDGRLSQRIKEDQTIERKNFHGISSHFN